MVIVSRRWLRSSFEAYGDLVRTKLLNPGTKGVLHPSVEADSLDELFLFACQALHSI